MVRSRASVFQLGTLMKLLARGRPLQHLVERRAERLAPVGEAIFDLWRYLVMDDPAHDAVPFQLPQLLDQHLLGDRWDGAFELRKAQHVAIEQMKQNDELPSAFENPQHLLYALRRRGGRVTPILTLR